MASIKLDIVTAEQQVFSDDVEMVVTPGVEGQLGILPHHAPLMTMVQPGELLIKKDGAEILMALSGGFMEVRPDRVIILADTAERAEEIDVARAEEAKQRAEKLLTEKAATGMDETRARAALHRSLVRLNVARKRQRRRS